MLLLGHRGCRGKYVENTFSAFDHALESGCHGFELDVRQTADAVPVIWHDARLRGRFISRHPFAMLSERCAVPGRLPRRPVIDLCRLEQVLARYAQVGWIDIELKVRGLEAQVLEILRRHRPARGFVVSSFRRSVLLELHRMEPTVPLGLIFDRMPGRPIWRELPVAFVKPSVRLITATRVGQFHADGLKVLTWTVNYPGVMRRMVEAGVDGVIGDDPTMLAKTKGTNQAATPVGATPFGL